MEQNGAEKQPSLSDKQLAALPYLVSPKSLSEAARLANVGRTTLYRWMNDPDFREELERRRQEAAELADTELKGLRLKALIVFAESMEDPDPYVRVRAAQVAYGFGIKSGDLAEVRKRLERVDESFHLWYSRNPPRP